MHFADQEKEATYSSILAEASGQRVARAKLLSDLAMEKYSGCKDPNAVIAHISRGPVTAGEIPILGNVLLNIGDVNTLSLILQSPGGEGTIVEKFVSLCRAHCKRFRVIIANEAKSAGTLIALGADEIIMGPCSELGPIDAQVPVSSAGIFRYISAQSFIDARDGLLKQFQEEKANNRDTSAILQMLASLDLPFITECERMMDFGRDVARNLLSTYMFKGAKAKKAVIEKVVKTLSSVKRFKVHGQIINGTTARTELGLRVKLLGKADAMWKKIFEYYTRAEIAMNAGRLDKIFETEHEMLVAASRQEGD